MVHKKSMRNIKRNSNKRSYRNIKRNVNKLSRKNIRKQIGGGGEEEINELRKYVENQPKLNELLLTEMKKILDECKPKKKGRRVPNEEKFGSGSKAKAPTILDPLAVSSGILAPPAATSGILDPTAPVVPPVILNSSATPSVISPLSAAPSGNSVPPAAPSGNSVPPAAPSVISNSIPSIITERPRSKKPSRPVPLPKVSTIIQNNSPSKKTPPPIAQKPTSPLKHINSYIRVIQNSNNDTTPNYKLHVAEYLKWIKKNNMTIDESLKNKLSEGNLLKIGLKKDGTEVPNFVYNSFPPY